MIDKASVVESVAHSECALLSDDSMYSESSMLALANGGAKIFLIIVLQRFGNWHKLSS
jgi:hypothetical protein